jgi:hypothetical protein
MNFLRRIIEWLTAKQEPVAKKWDPQTNPIDIQAIARQLCLREEGARLGAAREARSAGDV